MPNRAVLVPNHRPNADNIHAPRSRPPRATLHSPQPSASSPLRRHRPHDTITITARTCMLIARMHRAPLSLSSFCLLPPCCRGAPALKHLCSLCPLALSFAPRIAPEFAFAFTLALALVPPLPRSRGSSSCLACSAPLDPSLTPETVHSPLTRPALSRPALSFNFPIAPPRPVTLPALRSYAEASHPTSTFNSAASCSGAPAPAPAPAHPHPKTRPHIRPARRLTRVHIPHAEPQTGGRAERRGGGPNERCERHGKSESWGLSRERESGWQGKPGCARWRMRRGEVIE